MANVVLDMAMSLDGFVADRNRDLSVLFPHLVEILKTRVMSDMVRTTGAVLMGRRAYDLGARANGFADAVTYPYQVPQFVLTHEVPARPAHGPKFTFVTDGVASAIEQAKLAAGERNVTVIGGASTAQQCIRSGLLDEIQLHIVPLLLCQGLRLFENIDSPEFMLERTSAVESPLRTDLRYRVVKETVRLWNEPHEPVMP